MGLDLMMLIISDPKKCRYFKLSKSVTLLLNGLFLEKYIEIEIDRTALRKYLDIQEDLSIPMHRNRVSFQIK